MSFSEQRQFLAAIREPKKLGTQKRFGTVFSNTRVKAENGLTGHCEITLVLNYEDVELMYDAASIVSRYGMPRGSMVSGFGISARFGYLNGLTVVFYADEDKYDEIIVKVREACNESGFVSDIYEIPNGVCIHYITDKIKELTEKAETVLAECCENNCWKIQQVV